MRKVERDRRMKTSGAPPMNPHETLSGANVISFPVASLTISRSSDDVVFAAIALAAASTDFPNPNDCARPLPVPAGTTPRRSFLNTVRKDKSGS